MKPLKPCKTCKGKGWVFIKGVTIWTGKIDKFFDIEIPRLAVGDEKVICSKCFGKGTR